MGGCATKPKDLDSHQEPLQPETPDSPKKAEGETVPQENNGGETKKEEQPLIDISEPAQEASESTEPSTESGTAEPEVVSEEGKPAESTEDKVEAANEAKEPTSEEEKPEAEVAAPKPEDERDAPLVTV